MSKIKEVEIKQISLVAEKEKFNIFIKRLSKAQQQ